MTNFKSEHISLLTSLPIVRKFSLRHKAVFTLAIFLMKISTTVAVAVLTQTAFLG